MQLIQFQYRERSREGALGGFQGGAASAAVTCHLAMQGEEAILFDGFSKVDGTARICQQLVQWISEELKRKAEIDKAARNAREERVLARGAEHLSQAPPNVDLPSEGDKRQNVGNARW